MEGHDIGDVLQLAGTAAQVVLWAGRGEGEVLAAWVMERLRMRGAPGRNHLDFVLRHGRDLRIVLRERHHLSGARGESYLRMSERYQSTFTRLIAEGIESGALLPGDAGLLSLFLLGSANWIVEWFSPGGRLTADEVTERFVKSLIYNMMASQRPSLALAMPDERI